MTIATPCTVYSVSATLNIIYSYCMNYLELACLIGGHFFRNKHFLQWRRMVPWTPSVTARCGCASFFWNTKYNIFSHDFRPPLTLPWGGERTVAPPSPPLAPHNCLGTFSLQVPKALYSRYGGWWALSFKFVYLLCRWHPYQVGDPYYSDTGYFFCTNTLDIIERYFHGFHQLC